MMAFTDARLTIRRPVPNVIEYSGAVIRNVKMDMPFY